MNIIDRLTDLFTPVKVLPEGVYHLQAPAGDEKPFRLHLRLQKNGAGILILNASTVLQLNPTAAEYAFHFIRGLAAKDAAKAISSRYRIGKTQALQDYTEFVEKILALIHSTDLDPVSVLGFGLVQPNSADLSAPLRLDCALTYRLTPGSDPLNAPIKRVERELTTAEWQIVMDKAWAAGIPHIVFTGGEATLREDLPVLVAHAEKNGQVVGLLTDGNKLSDSSYLDNLLQTGLDHLLIVLPSEGEPNWQAVRNVVRSDIFFSVHLTVTPQNATRMEGLIAKIGEAGVKNISMSVSTSALQVQVLNLMDYAGKMGLNLVSDLPVPYSSAHPVAFEAFENAEPVGAGKSWLYVEPDGDVLPAQGCADQIMGNILTDSWETIYPVTR